MSKLQEFIKFIEPAFKDITLAEGTKLTQSYASSTAKITAKCKICNSVYGPSQAKNVKCKTPGCDISTLKILDLYKEELSKPEDQRVGLKETLKAMGQQKREAQQAARDQMRQQVEQQRQEYLEDNYDHDQEAPKTINVEDLVTFLKQQQKPNITKDELIHRMLSKFEIPEHKVYNRTYELDANEKNEYRVFKDEFEKNFRLLTPIEDKKRLTKHAKIRNIVVKCKANSHEFYVSPEVIPMLAEHGCPFCRQIMSSEDLEMFDSHDNKMRSEQFDAALKREKESSNKVIRKTQKGFIHDELDSIIAKAKQANAERVAAEQQAQDEVHETPDEAIDLTERELAHEYFYEEL